MPTCSAINCKSTSSGKNKDLYKDISFHTFPKQTFRAWETKVQVGRKDWKATQYSCLCSRHFTEDSYEEDLYHKYVGRGPDKNSIKRLKEGSLPSLHLSNLNKEDAPSNPRSKTVDRIRKKEHEETIASLLNATPASSQCESPKIKKHSKRKAQHAASSQYVDNGSGGEERIVTQDYNIAAAAATVVTEKDVSSSPPAPNVCTSVHVAHGYGDTPSSNLPDGYYGPYMYVVNGNERLMSNVPTPRRTARDHCYASTSGESTKRRQLNYELPSPVSQPQLAPIQQSCVSKDTKHDTDTEHEDISEIESIAEDDPNDTDYLQESSECDTEMESMDEQDDNQESMLREKKYIVFQSNLEQLMKFCSQCGAPIISKAQSHKYEGSIVTYHIKCLSGHDYMWQSQPCVRAKQPAGNVMIAGSIFVTGNSFTKVESFANAMNLKFISESCFLDHQKETIIPVVSEMWDKEKKKVMKDMKRRDTLILAGDARCDTPGHNAKYGSYSLMDADPTSGKKKIVAMNVVQVSEVKNSNHMEIEGLRRCLDDIKIGKLKLSVLATDRHLMIGSMMKKEPYTSIDHQFDIWHLVKSLLKKLWAKARSAENEDLADWMQSISNHFWWCVATCRGNAQLLREKWLSLLNHITNRHAWGGNQLFHKCEHAKLTLEQKRFTKWLNPKSEAYKALQSVVTATRFLNALPQVTKFCHTGELEVFHSMLLKYCPKRQHFHYESMVGHLNLASLAWNLQTHEIRTNEDGDPVESVYWNKRRKDWVKRIEYIVTSDNHVEPLMLRILEVKADNIQIHAAQKPASIPKHVAKKPKPDAADIKRVSRFSKTT